jgi:hypothetical protein
MSRKDRKKPVRVSLAYPGFHVYRVESAKDSQEVSLTNILANVAAKNGQS